jgi:hypothetical protein
MLQPIGFPAGAKAYLLREVEKGLKQRSSSVRPTSSLNFVALSQQMREEGTKEEGKRDCSGSNTGGRGDGEHAGNICHCELSSSRLVLLEFGGGLFREVSAIGNAGIPGDGLAARGFSSLIHDCPHPLLHIEDGCRTL